MPDFLPQVRSFGFNRDGVTGVDYVFAGQGPRGIFRGSYDATVAGRWSALPQPEPDSTIRAHFTAELLLNRYGVVTKGASEGAPGGFAMLYKVLTALEDVGRCQRGYFVESLGGAQFAVASTVGVTGPR